MKWLLDSNACIRYLNGRSNKLKERLAAVNPSELNVCSVVKAELIFGAAMSRNPEESIRLQQLFLSRLRSYPFDDACAETYATIRSHLKSAGTPIGPNDLMIAAIAITNQLTLITNNSSKFSRVPGLIWQDWEAE